MGIFDFAFSKIVYTCTIPLVEPIYYEVVAQLDKVHRLLYFSTVKATGSILAGVIFILLFEHD